MINFQLLSDALGAEASGIRLASLNEAEFRSVSESIAKYHLLCFRDQHLSLIYSSTISHQTPGATGRNQIS
uniref:Uncharacterized protein n=1 Tax=Candidatus Kentrum sp. SD TaxID=2126332 RepID=A0A450YDP2_9GAMM|nr:MAG: hypothetical protein BECKSD772F_GA0070984_100336 [Candidatus Kentron sp. SD]VFK39595.1 MAG: hypothetical protein BECKSD772E_GA0070983_100339 [Candidatus Kentron sp. SD]VFK78079.1 MAG: hypothetical protein BECKSD772D_GA0070982_100634 [Candidatus Kentron sp. SD]